MDETTVAWNLIKSNDKGRENVVTWWRLPFVVNVIPKVSFI